MLIRLHKFKNKKVRVRHISVFLFLLLISSLFLKKGCELWSEKWQFVWGIYEFLGLSSKAKRWNLLSNELSRIRGREEHCISRGLLKIYTTENDPEELQSFCKMCSGERQINNFPFFVGFRVMDKKHLNKKTLGGFTKIRWTSFNWRVFFTECLWLLLIQRQNHIFGLKWSPGGES